MVWFGARNAVLKGRPGDTLVKGSLADRLASSNSVEGLIEVIVCISSYYRINTKF